MDRKKWASALCAAAAIAAVGPVSGASAAVTAPHNVTALYNTSGLELSGYPAGAQLTAQVVRNGVTIGTASGAASAGGILDVNPTACWDTWTPEILPGDTVRVTGAGVADTTVVQNITAGAPVQSGANIVVHGTASDAAGNPLPLAEIENRLQAKSLFAKNGRKTLRAIGAGGGDGTISYDAPGSTAWTATYSGLSAADQQLALGALSRGIWQNAAANEVTIFDSPGGPGPAAPCTAPLARFAITGSTPSAVNRATLGLDNPATAQPLVLNGAASNASAVSVSIDDTNPATAPVVVSGTLSAPTGAQTWTASVPTAQLANLSDGTLTATATYTIATGTTTGVNLTIPKDTIAPAAPTASPAPGLFSSTQSLTLSDADATAKIRYTTDGTAPSPTSTLYGGPITVDFSRTIKAIAVDAAGNTSGAISGDWLITIPAGSKVAANLSGVSSTGKASLENKGGGSFLFLLEILKAPANSTLNVFIDGRQVTTVRTDATGSGKLQLTNAAAPPARKGSSIQVKTATGTVVTSGNFA
jgi:hypothetical protein